MQRTSKPAWRTNDLRFIINFLQINNPPHSRQIPYPHKILVKHKKQLILTANRSSPYKFIQNYSNRFNFQKKQQKIIFQFVHMFLSKSVYDSCSPLTFHLCRSLFQNQLIIILSWLLNPQTEKNFWHTTLVCL